MGLGKGSGGIGCGAEITRFILFAVNICFWVCGAAILGIGIWAKVDPTSLKFLDIISADQNGSFIQGAIWMLIGVGAFIFVIGFLGCCGACKKSTCMLWLYAFLLLLVIVLQITAAILAIVFKTKVETYLKEDLTKQVKEKYSMDDGLTKAWDLMQWQIQCCGGNNYTDYRGSNYAKKTGESVPSYCCKTNNTDDFEKPVFVNETVCLSEGKRDAPDEAYVYTKGCYDGLMDWITKNSGILIGVGIGIAGVEIIALVFACCLKNAINDENGY